MNFRYLIVILFAVKALSASGAEFALKATDLYTLSCINGIDFAEMRGVCSTKYPYLKDRLEKNFQGWQSRNVQSLQEVALACQERFRILEQREPVRLRELRAFAERTSKVPLLERPDVNKNNFQDNCHGLADSFADETRPSNLKSLAREIRTEGLEVKEQPTPSLQGTPAGGRP